MDLSWLHTSLILSINSLIPSPHFLMQYTTINHAITIICSATELGFQKSCPFTQTSGVSSVFAGREPTIVPSISPLAAEAAQKMFDTLSEALCLILINNYRLPYILHLLDDFPVNPTTPPPHFDLIITKKAFLDLNVPLSQEKFLRPKHLHRVFRHQPGLSFLSSFSVYRKIYHIRKANGSYYPS